MDSYPSQTAKLALAKREGEVQFQKTFEEISAAYVEREVKSLQDQTRTKVEQVLFRTRKLYPDHVVKSLRTIDHASLLDTLREVLSTGDLSLLRSDVIRRPRKEHHKDLQTPPMMDVSQVPTMLSRADLTYDVSPRDTVQRQEGYTHTPVGHNELQQHMNICYAQVKKQGGMWNTEHIQSFMDYLPYMKDALIATAALLHFYDRKKDASPYPITEIIAISDKAGCFLDAVSKMKEGALSLVTSHVYQDAWAEHHPVHQPALVDSTLEHVPSEKFSFVFAQNFEELSSEGQYAQLYHMLRSAKVEGCISMAMSEGWNIQIRDLLKDYGYICQGENLRMGLHGEHLESDMEEGLEKRVGQKLAQKKLWVFERTRSHTEEELQQLQIKLQELVSSSDKSTLSEEVKPKILSQEEEQALFAVLWERYLEVSSTCEEEEFMVYVDLFLAYDLLSEEYLYHLIVPLGRIALSLPALERIVTHIKQFPGMMTLFEETFLDRYIFQFEPALEEQMHFLLEHFDLDLAYLPEQFRKKEEEVIVSDTLPVPAEEVLPEVHTMIPLKEELPIVNLYGVEWNPNKPMNMETLYQILNEFLTQSNVCRDLAVPMWYLNIYNLSVFYKDALSKKLPEKHDISESGELSTFSSWHVILLIGVLNLYREHEPFIHFLRSVYTLELVGLETRGLEMEDVQWKIRNYFYAKDPDRAGVLSNIINALREKTLDEFVKNEQTEVGLLNRILKRDFLRKRFFLVHNGKLAVPLFVDDSKNYWAPHAYAVPEYLIKDEKVHNETGHTIWTPNEITMRIYLSRFAGTPPSGEILVPPYFMIIVDNATQRSAFLQLFLEELKITTIADPRNKDAFQQLKGTLFSYFPKGFYEVLLNEMIRQYGTGNLNSPKAHVSRDFAAWIEETIAKRKQKGN